MSSVRECRAWQVTNVLRHVSNVARSVIDIVVTEVPKVNKN